MGFWYFIRNFFKVIGLIIAIAILSDFTVDQAGDIGISVFLFFLFFATVSTTYDLGGGYFLKVTTGAGFGGAFIALFLAYAIMAWVAEHTAIVIGILLASYVINQIIETIKYCRELPKFFTYTGIFCIVIYAIEMICVFTGQTSFVFAMSYEGIIGFFKILAMFLTVIFTLVNIIARATQAKWVED